MSYNKSHNPYFSRWFSAIVFRVILLKLLSMVTILILVDGFLQYVVNCSFTTAIHVTILILVDGFLQYKNGEQAKAQMVVTILILVDGFLQYKMLSDVNKFATVTILILVDGFLQYSFGNGTSCRQGCHNPYFSRWFSAIWGVVKLSNQLGHVTILILVDGFLQYGQDCHNYNVVGCHNPYFSRWFSAIKLLKMGEKPLFRHNPYFSRWFSAISIYGDIIQTERGSQSLFQQMVFCNIHTKNNRYWQKIVTILILVDGFLQY